MRPSRYNIPMRRLCFQFRPTTVLLLVGGAAIYVGVMRAIWSDMELMFLASFDHVVVGVPSMIYGTKMIDVTRGEPWSRLLVVLGFMLICVGLVAGCYSYSIGCSQAA
jgi:hypothetical protein